MIIFDTGITNIIIFILIAERVAHPGTARWRAHLQHGAHGPIHAQAVQPDKRGPRATAAQFGANRYPQWIRRGWGCIYGVGISV